MNDWKWLGLPLAFFVTVSCANSAKSPEASVPTSREGSANFSLIDEALLFDGAYLQQEIQINESVRDCLKAAGFDYPVPPPDGADLVNAPIVAEVSVEEAGRTGFRSLLGKHTDADTTDASDPYQTYVDDLTASDLKAFESSNLSCVQDSIARVQKNAARYNEIRSTFELARGQFRERLLASEEISKLNKEWSACAQQSGLNFESPLKLLNDPGTIADGDSASSDEISMAVVYATCMESVAYVQRFVAVLHSAEKGFLEDQSQLIEEMRSTRYG